MESFITPLTGFVGGLNPVLQFLAVFVIGIVPYLESHFGSFVGTLTGVPFFLAALAAIGGNLFALFLATRAGSAVARRVAARRESGEKKKNTQKVLAKVDRFGVPVASLLGPVILPSALSTFIMISAGLRRRTVVTWQVVAVSAWGVAFTAIALGTLNALN